MKGTQIAFFKFSRKDVARAVVVLVVCIVLTNLTDIGLPWWVGLFLEPVVLYPLVLLWGPLAIVAVFLGELLRFSNISIGTFESIFVYNFEYALFQALAVLFAWLVVTKAKMRGVRLFVGSWVVNGLSTLAYVGWRQLNLVNSINSGYFYVYVLVFQIIHINIIGCLVACVLNLRSISFAKKPFAILGSLLSLISLALPWASRPPVLWFLWGLTFGNIPFAPSGSLFYAPLCCVLLGAILKLSSLLVGSRVGKLSLLLGIGFDALSIAIFISFQFTVLYELLGPVTFDEFISTLSYGLLIEGSAAALSFLSLREITL